jgi:CDGSH-type Zn-finger protein
MRIQVTPDGPYMVSGNVPLVRAEIVVDDEGESVGWRETERLETRETYSLCRCGHSSKMPYCDGTHVGIGFDGTETAAHDTYLDVADSIDGNGVVVLRDDRKLCAEARFCAHGAKLWNLIEHCDDPMQLAAVEEESRLCPSGRYTVCDPVTGEPHEPELEPSVVLVEDPCKEVSGPVWVRGGIEVVSAEGEPYEIRNRVTLCRCGESQNKPFCDGTHIGVGFRDYVDE